jgi:hypothetical protein
MRLETRLTYARDDQALIRIRNDDLFASASLAALSSRQCRLTGLHPFDHGDWRHIGGLRIL